MPLSSEPYWNTVLPRDSISSCHRTGAVLEAAQRCRETRSRSPSPVTSTSRSSVESSGGSGGGRCVHPDSKRSAAMSGTSDLGDIIGLPRFLHRRGHAVYREKDRRVQALELLLAAPSGRAGAGEQLGLNEVERIG